MYLNWNYRMRFKKPVYKLWLLRVWVLITNCFQPDICIVLDLSVSFHLKGYHVLCLLNSWSIQKMKMASQMNISKETLPFKSKKSIRLLGLQSFRIHDHLWWICCICPQPCFFCSVQEMGDLVPLIYILAL